MAVAVMANATARHGNVDPRRPRAAARLRIDHGRGRLRGAFTIIELLVVIAVIGLLVTLIVSIASQALTAQKEANTRGIMRGVGLAIDQFATEDPLRMTYNGPKNKTFGPYPPYRVFGNPDPSQHTVASLLEPDKYFEPKLYDLAARITRDLGGNMNEVRKWVEIAQWDNRAVATRIHDDNRALIAYLQAFAPATLSQIPANALRPLAAGAGVSTRGEFLNPTGRADILTDDSNRQILGVHDAWGVPMDYFLAVRVEWAPELRNGTGAFRVVERVPVLRSLGIEREVYEAREANAYFPPRTWLFDREIAGPFANINKDTGRFITNDRESNGWVRAVAAGPDDEDVYNARETYGYRPDQDPQQ